MSPSILRAGLSPSRLPRSVSPPASSRAGGDQCALPRLAHGRSAAAFLPHHGGHSSSATPYKGWEDPTCELRGHFAGGHFLSAVALASAASGNTVLKSRGDELVGRSRACQKKIGTRYLSAYPTELFEHLAQGKPVWAPFYTYHKIMAGLLDMYLLTGNTDALQIAEGMGQWAQEYFWGISADQRQRMLRTEYGGMNEVLVNLAASPRRIATSTPPTSLSSPASLIRWPSAAMSCRACMQTRTFPRSSARPACMKSPAIAAIARLPSTSSPKFSPRAIPQQLPNNPRRSLQRRIDLRLIFPAGLGNLRLAAARSADEFGHRAHQLARLNPLGQPRRHSGNQRDLALGLRGGQHHHALAQLLLQVVDQRPQLPALQRVGPQRHQLHALHFDARASAPHPAPRQPTSSAPLPAPAAAASVRLPARPAFAEGLRKAAPPREPLRRNLRHGKVLPEGVQRAQAGDRLQPPHARRNRLLAHES
jgi:hypothetical protein